MGFVRLLPNSPSKAAGNSVRPHSAEGRRGPGFVFFLVFFRAAIASGLVAVTVITWHDDLAALASFLRAVAEACSPQRFREPEENADVSFIPLS